MTSFIIALSFLAAIVLIIVGSALLMSGKMSAQEIDEGALEGDLTGYVHDLNKGSK